MRGPARSPRASIKRRQSAHPSPRSTTMPSPRGASSVLRDILAEEDGLTPAELYERFKRDRVPWWGGTSRWSSPAARRALIQFGYEGHGGTSAS
ncbi:MAG: hypothetical protein ABMA64_24975 [Myxococcota bacterium]